MAVVGCVAGVTGRVGRPGAHSPARPAGGCGRFASDYCPHAPCGKGASLRWGAVRREESRRRAPSQPTIQLVERNGSERLRYRR